MPGRLLFEDDEDENSGVQSAKLAEDAVRTGYHAVTSARNKNKDSSHNPEKTTGSNPYSKWRQRLEIKREYAAARAGRNAGTVYHASGATAKAAGQAVDKSGKAARFIAKHKKAVAVIIGIAAVIMIFSTVISSCSVMLSGMSSSITSTTYPCDDSDMLAAEARYCAMEETLRTKLDHYERNHSYDEYHFAVDEISHYPHVLISAVTALYGGEWRVNEIGGILQRLFDGQYILTENVTAETRYRTETQIDYQYYTDPETGEVTVTEYKYEVEIPYTYYIVSVRLENTGLSDSAVSLMSDDQLLVFEMYMSTLGNRPELFS